MADRPSDTEVGPGRQYPGMPRWVKAFGIGIIVLVLLVVVALGMATALGIHDPSIGPSGHGPGRDAPSGDTGIHTPFATVADLAIERS